MAANIVMKIIFVLLLLIPINASAAIQKEISFHATPDAVKVFQLKSTKKNLIGTTPFKYTVKFHSEQTQIRFLFEKPGYESQILEANIKKSKLRADLARKSILTDPDRYQSWELRNLQKQVNSSVDPVKLHAFLESNMVIDTIFVEERDKRVGLLIELSRPDGAKMSSKTLQQIWEKELHAFVNALRDQLSLPKGIDKVIIRVSANEIKRNFSVSHDTKRETVCNGGFELKYITTGAGGQYIRQWNPCLTKSTVEKTESTPVHSQKNVKAVHEFLLTSSNYQKRLFEFGTISTRTQ